MHRTIRYDLSRFADCFDGSDTPKKLYAFSIRTTDGTDESYASKRAEAKGTNMSEELIRFSIVAYECEDGQDSEGKPVVKTVDVKQPFESFDKWSTKARNFVVSAWKKLSTPNEVEIEDFFAHASEVA